MRGACELKAGQMCTSFVYVRRFENINRKEGDMRYFIFNEMNEIK